MLVTPRSERFNKAQVPRLFSVRRKSTEVISFQFVMFHFSILME